MGRFAGIDYGKRRIGVAISDFGARIASPAGALDGTGNASGDAAAILRWAAEQEATTLVLGLPLNMDGTDSDQTRLTRGLGDELRRRGSLAVELWDERLSSFQADALMESAGVRRSRRRAARDALAAQVILQSFLDAQRP
jgi:putative holliday junction resolvase